ncbi:hypothetical protein SODALDRAFT_347701 [Sodiomyces alkalinus F11]|uniref:Uncharacterized protein n=1 Tax=Sodiomyces alkalinus (strain CBS 110278 / VKM F-3762 / F11) TaxID=1314773 RepID=A0A3N2Q7R9_SODAK|nr:hypothetical protein SODALDRAFT_347701 [Sodiomyces alkalinus F11]ROT42823.1 hypothetical protein SODALDRAFT_347701 [Sodiomyces alkalinus F11]
MSPNPSSPPVKVPPSAADYSPATLDPDLRSQINAVLLKEGHVQRIQERLLHALHANKANWPTHVQSHALDMLRSGDVTTFPTLLRRVLEDVRHDTLTRPQAAPDAHKANGTKTNGVSGSPAASSPAPLTSTSAPSASSFAVAADGKPTLALPTAVVEEMLKVVRESLEEICEVGEDGRV